MDQKIKQIGIFLLRVHDCFRDGCFYISAWMMLAMALIIGYEVFMRYFLMRPTSWVDDCVDYTLLYTTFLSSVWILKHGEHVNLTVLTSRLSPRSQRIMEVISSLFGATVCAFIIWYGAADTWNAFERDIVVNRPVQVPKYLFLGIIPFSYLLLLVQFVRNAFKSLRD